jgi:diaminopimelate epimerase
VNGRVAVTKMHGARNDFVVLDARQVSVPDLASFARIACDRRSGVGADGLLVIERSQRAPVAMRVINADGSEAEMCGNGIRCVARYLEERGEGGEFAIDTMAGIIRTMVLERGQVYRVRVDLGIPRIVTSDANGALVEVGNPHLVLFLQADIDAVDLEAVGRSNPGINVHLVNAIDASTLRVRHYERGVGLTMACGTGSAACAVAAIAREAVQSPVRVLVPGGELTIEIERGRAFMTGPAERVFETTI